MRIKKCREIWSKIKHVLIWSLSYSFMIITHRLTAGMQKQSIAFYSHYYSSLENSDLSTNKNINSKRSSLNKQAAKRAATIIHHKIELDLDDE